MVAEGPGAARAPAPAGAPQPVRRLGLIVNPIAGMGGRVGLKGTDGPDIVRRARELGARPESPERAEAALQRLAGALGRGAAGATGAAGRAAARVEILTCPGPMGEGEARAAGLEPRLVECPIGPETTSADTALAAREMAAAGVDLLVFAGGDGTARDVCGAIGLEVPALGIPTGVKMHSAVHATTPAAAGNLMALFVAGRVRHFREAEVMDIDEEAFRDGRVTARLYGYLRVPAEPRLVQNLKAGSGGGETPSLRGLAVRVAAEMERDCLYVIGPGTTTRAITDELGLPKTLLGVDVVCNGRVIAADAGEEELLGLVSGRRARIIVTVIGGQGYLFGRGNQQLSHRVLRAVGKENIIVVAAKEKLLSLSPNPLLVDTGDDETDRWLAGHIRVITGAKEQVVCRVAG